MPAKILGKLKGIIASASETSRNGRKYTERFWDSIFDSELFKEGIKNKVYFGELWHPDDDASYGQIHADPLKSAVVLTNVEKKNLDYIGTFEILPTLAGETLKNLIDIGCVFGISSRGYNDYETAIFDDPSTYELVTFDVVAFPGIKSARLHPVTAVAEGYFNSLKVNKIKIMEKLNKLSDENNVLKNYIDNTLKVKENIEKESINSDLSSIKKKFFSDSTIKGRLWTAIDLTDDEMNKIGYFGKEIMNDGKKHNVVRLSDNEYNNIFNQQINENFDIDLQIEDSFPEIFNDIEDKDLLQYANVIIVNERGIPYFDDGRHGRLRVVTYPDKEVKPGEKYLVNDIWYSDITNQYIVGSGEDWLLIS